MIVPPSLIVRLKSHFHTLPFGVDLIIGLNGYIWVSKTVAKPLRADGEEAGFGEESGEGVYSSENEVRDPVFTFDHFVSADPRAATSRRSSPPKLEWP